MPNYDVGQLLWIEREWVYFAELIRCKVHRLNLNVGGSDFYRAETADREYKRTIVNMADFISAETSGTIKDFSDYYGDCVRDKIGYLPFGVRVLNYIEQVNIDSVGISFAKN